MTRMYQNALLTIIAFLLGAIVAKLYMPQAQQIGPRLGVLTRGELLEAKQSGDRKQLRNIRTQLAAVWVDSGNIEAEITDTLEVTIEQDDELSLMDLERSRPVPQQ